MKLNINVGWFITIIILGIVAGWFAAYFTARMQKKNKTGMYAVNGGEAAAVPVVEAPAVAA